MRDSKIHITSYFNPHFITDEMATFYHALKDYGFNQVTFEPYKVVPDAVNILFCGFNLGDDLQKSLTLAHPVERIIVRNLEPVFPTGPCMFPSYFNLMKKYPVWDYAEGNVARLKAAGIDQAEYVPVSYMPVLERIPTNVEQDIDVYFYGYLSHRRQHIIDQLIARGLKVHVNEFFSSAAYGSLDQFIARSKIILNMTNYDQYHVFEMVRAALPLANHKVVVTELNTYSEIDPEMKNAILHCPYDQLVDFCVSVVNDPELRKQYENQGYATLKQRSGIPIIGAAMDRYLENTSRDTQISSPAKRYDLPKKMRLESGERWSFDYLNIDTDPNVRSDLTLEIGQSIDFSADLNSWRFGQVQLKEGYFNYINAENVMQSVGDLTIALENCVYLLAEDGILEVTVPYYLATSAWRHPKTKRAFNEQSFAFLNNKIFNLSGQQYTLQITNLMQIMESYGMEIHTNQNLNIEQLSRLPNAIMSLSIKFTKKRVAAQASNTPLDHLNNIYQRARYHYD
jgi:hypothetical protein